MKSQILLLSKIIVCVAAIAAISAALRASAVPVTFSGGSGTPLSFTLSQPVTYVITASAANAPYFVFQNVGLGFFSSFATGTITFSINGGPAQGFGFQMQSGASFGSITANDFSLFGTLAGLTVNDVVVLTAGTLTTQLNVAEAAPASGDFSTFIADNAGNIISAFGTSGSAVPESLSTLWLGLPLLGMFAAHRLRTGVRRC